MDIRVISILSVLFSATACREAAPLASSSHSESAYQVPDQITLFASATRDAHGGTIIEGTTNLPGGTKIGVELMNGNRPTAQDFSVYVESGRFRSHGFTKGGSPLPSGRQKVHIGTSFNNNWQSQSVLNLLGKGGSKLKPSTVIRLDDPQLLDSEKVLDYTAYLIIPPVSTTSSNASSPVPSTADKVIAIVKNAVLTVDGLRSSESVEGGALLYFKMPGVRMGNGWSATQISEDTYHVSLDFINTAANKEQHDTALWEVNVVTKKVLYRNQYAKGFSWVPKD